MSAEPEARWDEVERHRPSLPLAWEANRLSREVLTAAHGSHLDALDDLATRLLGDPVLCALTLRTLGGFALECWGRTVGRGALGPALRAMCADYAARDGRRGPGQAQDGHMRLRAPRSVPG